MLTFKPDNIRARHAGVDFLIAPYQWDGKDWFDVIAFDRRQCKSHEEAGVHIVIARHAPSIEAAELAANTFAKTLIAASEQRVEH